MKRNTTPKLNIEHILEENLSEETRDLFFYISDQITIPKHSEFYFRSIACDTDHALTVGLALKELTEPLEDYKFKVYGRNKD